MKPEEEVHKKQVRAWCMYDWANSAFATTIIAAVLPSFYRDVVAGNLPEGQQHIATSMWGYTASIAMLGVAILALVMGPISDRSHARKRFLSFFAGQGVIATALLVFVGTGDWLLCSFLYILGTIGFAGANVFYDALLPHVARPEEIDQVSARGYALGYLGGGILLAINLAWIMKPQWFFMADAQMASRVSFLSVAIWWGIFSVPLLRYVPEPPGAEATESTVNPVAAGIGEIVHTFREIRHYSEAMKFLVAFWLYNDGIGTIIKMAVIYGGEIGIGQSDLIGAILLTQFVGIPCTILFGRLARKWGAKSCIYIALVVYTAICIGGYFMSIAWHFWVLAVAVGLVQGGSQALSRSLFASMIPKAKSAEFFAFYNISGKFAGIVGPLVFAMVSQWFGTSRLGIVSLIAFFVLGAAVLSMVDPQKGLAEASRLDV